MNERTNEEKFFSPYVRSENLNERESIVWNLNVNSRSIPIVFGFIVLFGSAFETRYIFQMKCKYFYKLRRMFGWGAEVSTGEERRTLSVSIVDIGRFGFLAQDVNLTDYVYNLNTEHRFINNFLRFRESLREVSASFPLHAKEIDSSLS